MQKAVVSQVYLHKNRVTAVDGSLIALLVSVPTSILSTLYVDAAQ